MSIDLEKIKLQREIEKLELEAQKIKLEQRELKKSRARFYLGTIIVPLLVTIATTYVVLQTKIFDATKLNIKNERFAFNQEKDSINNSIAAMRDCIGSMSDSISMMRDSTNRARKSYDSLNSSYKYLNAVVQRLQGALNQSGPVVKTLAIENASLTGQNSDLSIHIKSLHDSLLNAMSGPRVVLFRYINTLKGRLPLNGKPKSNQEIRMLYEHMDDDIAMFPMEYYENIRGTK